MPNAPEYAMCITSKLYPELLTLRRIYRVLAREVGEGGYLWIVDDLGNNGFFNPYFFVFVTFSVDVERYFPLPIEG